MPKALGVIQFIIIQDQKNVHINKTGLQKNESSTNAIINVIMSVGNPLLHACPTTQVMYLKVVKTL